MRLHRSSICLVNTSLAFHVFLLYVGAFWSPTTSTWVVFFRSNAAYNQVLFCFVDYSVKAWWRKGQFLVSPVALLWVLTREMVPMVGPTCGAHPLLWEPGAVLRDYQSFFLKEERGYCLADKLLNPFVFFIQVMGRLDNVLFTPKKKKEKKKKVKRGSLPTIFW